MSKFKKLVGELQKEGKSEESAKKIAYSIGAKKYGKAGMAKKAAAGRKKSYRVGGKTPVEPEPLTEKERAIIAAERERLRKARRKNKRDISLARYGGEIEYAVAKELGEEWDPTRSRSFRKYFVESEGQRDSLDTKGSPMHQEYIYDLNRGKTGGSAYGPKMFGLGDRDRKTRRTIRTRTPEERYRAGLKKNPDYDYKLKKGGKVKAKKYKRK